MINVIYQKKIKEVQCFMRKKDTEEIRLDFCP